MSRGIRYRIWDIDNKEFVYISETTDGEIWINNGVSTVTMPEHKGLYEQSTGLKDKNGKEIYEGDIVSVYEFDKKSLREVYKYTTDIRWNNRSAMFWTGHAESLCDEITEDHYEVIGNIHENKELLDKSNQV